MITNPYEFWITQADVSFQLPVNPQGISFTDRANDKFVEINELGSTTLKRPSALLQLSFSSEFPKEYWQGCAYEDIPDPEIAQQIIQYMKELGPVRFLITGTIHNYLMTIQEFSVQESGGDVGTKNFTLSLREFRNKEVKKIRIEKQQAVIDDFETRLDEKAKVKNYTVQEGDSLWKIAKKTLDDGDRWNEIADLNEIKKPYIINIGQVIKIL